jgi:type II secretion system protein C
MRAWRDRILSDAPWLVSLLLGALIAVDLARASVSLLGARPAEAREPALLLNTGASNRPAVDVRGILAAHLFGVSTDPSTEDSGDAPRTTANLLLAGTIATEDPKHGLAIISDGGAAKLYKVGDGVAGAFLHSVYLDYVILDRSGSLEKLLLPRLLLAEGNSLGRESQAPRATSIDDPAGLEHTESRSSDEVMRVLPAVDGWSKKLRGFRMYPSRNTSAFAKTGLRGGDLVIAVNGTSLAGLDQKAGQQILDNMKTSSQTTLTVELNGQTRDVSVDMTQGDP